VIRLISRALLCWIMAPMVLINALQLSLLTLLIVGSVGWWFNYQAQMVSCTGLKKSMVLIDKETSVLNSPLGCNSPLSLK
jgi:hypothetical protein